LEAQILKAIEKLTHDLSQLRGGGKLNPEVVESLKVQLGTAGEGKESVKLGDIAQVVPRGRMMNVVCGEEAVSAHVPSPTVLILTTSSISNPSQAPSLPRRTPSRPSLPNNPTP